MNKPRDAGNQYIELEPISGPSPVLKLRTRYN
jgi:hypothetical protein